MCPPHSRAPLAALAFALLAAVPASADEFEALETRLREELLARVEQNVAATLDARISAALERAVATRRVHPATACRDVRRQGEPTGPERVAALDPASDPPGDRVAADGPVAWHDSCPLRRQDGSDT